MAEDERRSDFTETLWSMDEKTLIDFMKARVGRADYQTALPVLQAKALIAARDVALWTKRLTWVTTLLAFVAVAAIIFD